MAKFIYFLGGSIGANLLLAVVAISFSEKFVGSPGLCYFVGIATVAAGTIAIGGFLTEKTGPAATLTFLILHTAAMISVFAAIHAGFGLHQAAQPVPWHTALYFSIVTWTTLGYGDFTAKSELQLLAALEALAGYVFFGLIVGVTTSLISRTGR